MLDITTRVFEYICKANNKIAELSTIANDLLEETGCNCDISLYVDQINDINSSLYILNKGWDNIELTFGYKNFLLALFPLEDFDPASATLEILDAYIDRYSMQNSSNIIFPLTQILNLGGGGCCDGFIGTLYYNKTDSDARYYPRYQNPEGYLKDDSLVGLATEAFVTGQGYLAAETDPTVPAYVKAITQVDIDSWDAKVSAEADPTVPVYVKAITQADIDFWNLGGGIQEETDPTVPSYVKSISNLNILNWNEAYASTLDLNAIVVPTATFTLLAFNRLGGYIIGTKAAPLIGGSIPLAIGADVKFSRAVIYHQGASKPSFSGTGISVKEVGDYLSNQVNEIILFYNGFGNVVVFYTGEVSGQSKRLVVRGSISAISDTSVNLSDFQWEIDGALFLSGILTGIPVISRPSSGIRVDSFWGDSNGNVLYIQGSSSFNEFLIEYPSRVLLSVFYRKPNTYAHPSYTPVSLSTSGPFIVSSVNSDSIGSIISATSRELSKADLSLGSVDNTSDVNKPVSTAQLAAISALDLKFLRKDQNDVSTFTLGLGGLSVSGAVTMSGLTYNASPNSAVSIMSDGSIVVTDIVLLSDITNLSDRIDGVELTVSLIVEDKNFSYIQAVATNVWGPIFHNLNKRPAIDVYDSDGNTVRCAVEFLSMNSVNLYFTGDMSGTVDFN